MTLTGTLAEALVKPGGRELASLLLDEGTGGPPLAIRGDIVLLWRQGAPVQARAPQVPPGLVIPQLQLANGGRPQG